MFSNLRRNLNAVLTIAMKDIVDSITNKTILSLVIGLVFIMFSGKALPWILRMQAKPKLVVHDPGNSVFVDTIAEEGSLGLIVTTQVEEMLTYMGDAAEPVVGISLPQDFDQLLNTATHQKVSGWVNHLAYKANPEELIATIERIINLESTSQLTIEINEQIVYPQPNSRGQTSMITIVAVISLITIGGFLTPHLLIEEKEKHTLEVLLVSPVSYSQIVIGKVITGIFYGIITGLIVLLFNIDWVIHWDIAFLAIFCGAVFAVSVGLLMGVVFDNPGTMNLWFGIVILFLIIPVVLGDSINANFPVFLRWIIPWIPSVALSEVMKLIFTGFVPADILWRNLPIIVGASVLLLWIVTLLLRRTDR